MKPHPHLLLAITSLFSAVTITALSAAPKIEETILGPVNVGGLFTLAPGGGHAAYMGRKYGKLVMTVDGVEGPQFDEIYKAAGGGAFFPQKAGVWPGTLGGEQGHDAPVLFSLDGSHHAYAGTQGKDYVVIQDGKEIGRGPWELMGRRGLTMSPGGKFVYWTEARLEQGRSVVRTLVNGVPGPWTFGAVTVVFSGNDSRYAYYLNRTMKSDGPVVVVDGKEYNYDGTNPKFTADGKLLIAHGFVDNQSVLFVDGKPVIKGAGVSKVVVAPVGHRYAVLMRRLVRNQPIEFLYVDGKEVAGADQALDVSFSPDGKRYAAVSHSIKNRTDAMIVDGKRGPELTRIDDQPPFWTGDGSKVIYTATSAVGPAVVVDDEVIPCRNPLIGPKVVTVAEKGGSYAWGTLGRGNRDCTLIVDGKSVLPPAVYPVGGTLTFSPDGSRFAFLTGPAGRGEVTGIIIDDELQTGLAPGYFARPDNALSSDAFRFSADGKHIAYVARGAAVPRGALFVDGRAVYSRSAAIYQPAFSADGRHLSWLAEEIGPGIPRSVVAYVDGEEAVRGEWELFRYVPGAWTVDGDGVATYIAVVGDVAKRFRITPSADVTVATLLEKGSAGTVASATPKPTTVATTPSLVVPKPVAASVAKTAALPTVALTWNDLTRRPETRPATCAVNRESRFQGGLTVRAGTMVNVIEFKPAGLIVGTTDGRTNFAVKPEDTDILAIANEAWARLTPAQRELTYPGLLQRMDLWPYRLKLMLPFQLEGRKTRVGDPALLLGLESNELFVRLEGTDLAINVQPEQTDIMAQARAILADGRGAPGRVLEEFAGKVVSPLDGRSVTLAAEARPKYVLMYMGAGWCGPCQQFSPKLMQALKQKAFGPEDVAMFYLSGDRSPAEARAYATKIGFDWPTLYFKNRGQLPAFGPLFGNVIPQLVVTDRHGKVVINSSQGGYDRALAQLRQLP